MRTKAKALTWIFFFSDIPAGLTDGPTSIDTFPFDGTEGKGAIKHELYNIYFWHKGL